MRLKHRQEKLAKKYTLREDMSSKGTPWRVAHPRIPQHMEVRNTQNIRFSRCCVLSM